MLKLIAKLNSCIKQQTQLKITFQVPLEENEIDELELLQADKMEGYLLFNPDPIKAEVEKAIKNKRLGVSEKGQTKSQRIRGLLAYKYLNSNKLKNKYTSYEDFYNAAQDWFYNYIKTNY